MQKRVRPLQRRMKPGSRSRAKRDPQIQLERFSLSGDVGGSKSFTIPGFRRQIVQVITVGVISSGSLVLKGVRFSFQNKNVRLRVQVKGSKRFYQSDSNKVDATRLSKLLYTESVEAKGVELQVMAVNKIGTAATLHPQDGWWLDLALNKQT